MQQKNQYTALLLLLNGLYCGTLKRTEITPITGNSTPPRSPLTVAQHLILIVSIPAPPTRQAVLPKRLKGLSCPCGKTTRWCLRNFLVGGKFDKSKIATQVAYVDAFFSVGCTLASCKPRRLPFILTIIHHFYTASLKYEAPSDVRENGGGQQ